MKQNQSLFQEQQFNTVELGNNYFIGLRDEFDYILRNFDVLFCDGFLFGSNPSSFGGGFTVVNSKGSILSIQKIYKENFTNNEAELLAIWGAAKLSNNNTYIITDSQNSILWLKKGKSKARPDLNEIIKEIEKIIQTKSLKVFWFQRSRNLAGIYNQNNKLDDILIKCE